jgi:D-alanyl-D-alanine carboxypeptidase
MVIHMTSIFGNTMTAVPTSAAPMVPTTEVPPLDRLALRAAISDLPATTAAQLRVRGSAGPWFGTAGTADPRTGESVRGDQKFRIGGITEVFVATVVLQLAAEHRVNLTTPIQHYLPDLLPKSFKPITIGQLLNHTSALPAEDRVDPATPESVVAQRFDQWTPERIVAGVTHTDMVGTPGTVQEYRSVDYVLAALLIEKVTGHSYGEEIGRRILRPLGLANTSVPGDDPVIHGAHVRGYLEMTGGELIDITEGNQSAAWGAGEMISTTSDLDAFLSALFFGRLLPPDLLELMFTLPDVPMKDARPARYSMGLHAVMTASGLTLWGKTGRRHGYTSGMFATRHQERRVVYSFAQTRSDVTQQRMAVRVVDLVTKPAHRGHR